MRKAWFEAVRSTTSSFATFNFQRPFRDSQSLEFPDSRDRLEVLPGSRGCSRRKPYRGLAGATAALLAPASISFSAFMICSSV
jgi:hypothetical protein